MASVSDHGELLGPTSLRNKYRKRIKDQAPEDSKAKELNSNYCKFLQYVPNSPVAREGELDSDLIPIEFDFQSYLQGT